MSHEKPDGVLTFLVRHTWLSMRAVIEDELEAHGMTVPRFATLMMLAQQPGLSIADVSRICASTRQAANEMVTGLEREGLVVRSAHPTDRRTHQVHMTDSGRERYVAALPAVLRREAELEAGLSDAQREAARGWMLSIVAACRDA
jgi:DNA-binding MarR family transcriptional regulator